MHLDLYKPSVLLLAPHLEFIKEELKGLKINNIYIADFEDMEGLWYPSIILKVFRHVNSILLVDVKRKLGKNLLGSKRSMVSEFLKVKIPLRHVGRYAEWFKGNYYPIIEKFPDIINHSTFAKDYVEGKLKVQDNLVSVLGGKKEDYVGVKTFPPTAKEEILNYKGDYDRFLFELDHFYKFVFVDR